MAINDGLSPLTPHQAAQEIGVGVQSIRRWCEWHSAHLSAGASPEPSVPRRLTKRDVEVLKEVSALRYQGLQTEAINDRLKTMVFPEIDNDADTVDTAAIAPPASPGAPQSTPAPIMAPEYLLLIERRFEALEASSIEAKQSHRDFVVGLALGALGMGLLILLLLLLFLVRHWL